MFVVKQVLVIPSEEAFHCIDPVGKARHSESKITDLNRQPENFISSTVTTVKISWTPDWCTCILKWVTRRLSYISFRDVSHIMSMRDDPIVKPSLSVSRMVE